MTRHGIITDILSNIDLALVVKHDNYKRARGGSEWAPTTPDEAVDEAIEYLTNALEEYTDNLSVLTERAEREKYI